MLRPPISLKPGDTADDRRVLAGVTTGQAVPTTAKQGFGTKFARWVRVTVNDPDGTVTFDTELYGWDDAAEAWHLVRTYGTAGTVSHGTNSENSELIVATGFTRLFLRATNFSGAPSAGANAWMTAVHEVA